jgi:hypothetical protein
VDRYTFLIFIGLLLIFFLLTFFFVPETKAKTVDAIYAEIDAGQVWRKHHYENRIGLVDYGISGTGNENILATT